MGSKADTSVLDVLRKWHELVQRVRVESPPEPGTLYPSKMAFLENGSVEVTLRRVPEKGHVPHQI